MGSAERERLGTEFFGTGQQITLPLF
jgi:hypothetical protein